MSFAGIIFDFDGVLIESEYDGNRHLAGLLTTLGHPTSVAEALAQFTGLSGEGFRDAVATWIGRPIPPEFDRRRDAENLRAVAEGVAEVAGAVAFVRSLPPSLPRAIASSSTTRWIEAHLDHIGLRDAFGEMIFSGREHVARGKPAPDLYLHAARAMGVPIGRTLIVEDSPVGMKGAVASGATVVGLTAGRHCDADHGGTLRELGAHHLAADFGEVARILAL